MYDIIGDIHGEYDALLSLLQKLGYVQDLDSFRHHSRKAIFLGDFISKGDKSREVVSLIKKMVKHEAALAVIGNHELYLVSYFSRNASGVYIRPHSEANTFQQSKTLLSYGEDKKALEETIIWFKSLPLFLDMPELRIVHGCWHQPSINWIISNYPENCLSDRLLFNLIQERSMEWSALKEILIGHKLMLPESVSGETFKAKWWKMNKTNEYQHLATRPNPELGEILVSPLLNAHEYQYAAQEKPLFFGHYNLPGMPELIAGNFVCLDYGLDNKPLLTAYRWQGEKVLKTDHLVTSL